MCVFSNCVLYIIIYSTVGYHLIIVFYVKEKFALIEMPVVGMVIPDINSSLPGVGIKTALGLHYFVGC